MNAVMRVDPRTDGRWAELAGQGGLFTSPRWISAVSTAYDFLPTAGMAVDATGRPTAGVAWVDVEDLRGARRIALPFCDRADPLVVDGDAWAPVLTDALSDGVPFTLRCSADSPAASDDRLLRTGEAALHRTPLNGSVEDLRGRLRPAVRRNIAVAERAGVEVVVSDTEEAAVTFHRLHVALRKRKYRLLAQPRAFVEHIWHAFAPADAIRTALAVVDGRPVAGAVVLVWGDVAYYKFGASLAPALSLRPNEAVHWALLKWATERGLTAFDWGLSDLDQPGLVAYKRKWAGQESRIVTVNAGGAPLGRRADTERLLRTLTELLTDESVPDDITERAGAALYRHFC